MVCVFQIHPKSLKMCIYEALTVAVIAFFFFLCLCMHLSSGVYVWSVYSGCLLRQFLDVCSVVALLLLSCRMSPLKFMVRKWLIHSYMIVAESV